MTTEVLDGEDLVMMIMEGASDADDQELAAMLTALMHVPVRVVAQNKFEVDWEDDK